MAIEQAKETAALGNVLKPWLEICLEIEVLRIMERVTDNGLIELIDTTCEQAVEFPLKAFGEC